MNCIVCFKKYKDINQLFQHYIQVHKTNIENYFFKDSLKIDAKVFVPSKYLRCQNFFVNSRD